MLRQIKSITLNQIYFSNEKRTRKEQKGAGPLYSINRFSYKLWNTSSEEYDNLLTGNIP